MSAEETIEISESDAVVAVVHQRVETLAGIQVELTPARVYLDLRPEPAGSEQETVGRKQWAGGSVSGKSVQTDARQGEFQNPKSRIQNSKLWHSVEPHPATIRVAVTSELEQPTLLRCRVRPTDEGFDPSWVRWRYALRRVPDHLGGDAVERQDVLGDHARSVTLMLLPGERRVATLELHAWLEGATRPGHYGFDVVVEEAEGKNSLSRPGLITLRTPVSMLLRHLPGIYQEEMQRERDMAADELDSPFFERFLRGFEDALEPVQRTLSDLDHLLGGRTAPTDMLPWLATWVALALDDNWPELRRRRLIREAVELYKWRGTRRGLTRYLELYTGAAPEIDDQPIAGMKLGPNALLGTPQTILGGLPTHCFKVTVTVPEDSTVNEQTVRAIVEAEKPAHTAYELRFVRSG